MSDLDSELKEILLKTQPNAFEPLEVLSSDEAVARIRQAFTDAGYVQTVRAGDRTIVLNGKDPLGFIVYYPDEVMTGQEFVDRFKAELKGKHFRFFSNPDDLTNTLMIVEDAARRAANINETKENT